ncbi:chemotaxis protein CheB [Noviherbaspirillum massiliense]|uniref:chemotaxis protein CheB n=1 Tax=Noviherbaspirillum massiliense TaxID=1465823 RepID=UPI0002FA0196|nr:chemotaxis protein CheB [Noviherbaspirillum massiliense]
MSEKRDMVVIGASTGGLEALKHFVARLPQDFPAAILIVLHIGSQETSLPQILMKHSALPVRNAIHGEPIEPGVILLAPPDVHLMVNGHHVHFSNGPKENFSRPAIDPLFRSAALSYRSRVIGIILTGNLDDGTVGLQAVKAYGGLTIVQDPRDADAPSMPLSAIEHVDVDYCLPLYGIAETLVKLTAQAAPPEPGDVPGAIPEENRIALTGKTLMDELEKIAEPSTFTCPECHGSLWEIKGTSPRRFRCHTGHGFTARTLAHAQTDMAEEAIWGAIRALHEKEMLLKRLAQTASDTNRMEDAAEHAAAARQAARQAGTLRKMVSDARQATDVHLG